MNVVCATSADRDTWDAFVLSRPDAQFYHKYAWMEVLRESFGYEPVYLAAYDNGMIVGILPLFLMRSAIMGTVLVSLPFLNYGGIVANSDEAAAALRDEAVARMRAHAARYVEVRHCRKSPLFPVTREHKVAMVVAVPRSADDAWRHLDAKVRNQVRKGERSGLGIRVGSIDLLDAFYPVFCRNMRDLGTPVIGKRFFVSLFKQFPDDTSIITVTCRGVTVAAGVMIRWGNTVQMPWASSVREYNKMCPNEFMYWEAIKHAASRGALFFDFGRCSKGTGSYRFKKQWRPEEKQLYWQYLTDDPRLLPSVAPQRDAFSVPVTVWKRLPLWLAGRIGPVIARHLVTF